MKKGGSRALPFLNLIKFINLIKLAGFEGVVGIL